MEAISVESLKHILSVNGAPTLDAPLEAEALKVLSLEVETIPAGLTDAMQAGQLTAAQGQVLMGLALDLSTAYLNEERDAARSLRAAGLCGQMARLTGAYETLARCLAREATCLHELGRDQDRLEPAIEEAWAWDLAGDSRKRLNSLLSAFSLALQAEDARTSSLHAEALDLARVLEDEKAIEQLQYLAQYIRGDVEEEVTSDNRAAASAALLQAFKVPEDLQAGLAALEAGADGNLSDSYCGGPLLVSAAGHRDVDWVLLLLRFGANPAAVDNSGWNALQAVANEAGYPGATRIAQALLERGAPVDAKNSDGGTALVYACMQGSPEAADLVRLLLEHGADPELSTFMGTPLAFANGLSDQTLYNLMLPNRRTRPGGGPSPVGAASSSGCLGTIASALAIGVALGVCTATAWAGTVDYAMC